MPKPKPDQVVRHEFVLGKVEREQFDTLITGLTVRNVSQPFVAILSDPVALLAVAGILEATGVINLTGLAKKLGGQGADWIAAVLAGAYVTLQEALDAWYEKAELMIDEKIEGFEEEYSWLLGGTRWTPFSGGGIPQEYQLPMAGRAWAMMQIYSQQAVTQPAYPGMGGAYY